MNYGQLLHDFFADTKVQVALLLIALDFIFGVLSAFKVGNFRLAYVADFARNDILYKLVPYFVVYAGALVAGHQEILIPNLDLGVIAGAFYTGLVAAWVASIVNSLGELGLPVPGVQTLKRQVNQKHEVFANENAAPPKE